MGALSEPAMPSSALARNAAFLLAARVVSAATTLAVLAIVGRTRGAEALGVVGIGFALGSIAAAVADGGSASLLIREASRDAPRAGSLLGAALTYRAVSIPLTLVVVWLVAGFAVPDQAIPVLLVAAGLVAQSVAELTRSVFNARQRMAVSAGHTIIENLVWLAGIVGALAAGLALDGVFAVALGLLAGSVAAGLILDVALAGVRPRLASQSEWRALARHAAPFAAFSVVGVAYARIDPLLIGLLLPGPALAAAGAYFAASRLVAAFEYLPEAVSRAAYPELSRRVVERPTEVVPLLGRGARVLVLVGAIVPGAALVGGPWLLETIFGTAIGAYAWVVAALAVVVPFRFLGYLWGTALTSSDAQGRRVAAALVALGIVMVTEVVLLPTLGILGAVLAALAAAIAVSALYGRHVRSRFGAVGLEVRVAALAVGSAVAATVVGIALRAWIGAGPAALATVAVYGVAAALGPLRADVALVRPVRSAR